MRASGDNISNTTSHPIHYRLVLLLFFFSGLAALVYEVLWIKELGLLFGNTAFASATTLAAFFLGLAVGGYFWGQRAAGLDNPLQTYGLLELAAAISVVGYFLILDGYHGLYPTLFATFGDSRWAFIALKFLLALLILFPPAFFIGGTLPVISQYLVQGTQQLGLKISILYAINTLGAAIGALLAGFYLPRIYGFSMTYWMAIGCTTSVGLVALIIARRHTTDTPVSQPKPAQKASANPEDMRISLPIIRVLVLLSGFGTLCLQILWTRMFAQVLQNSVYTFASIVIVFLMFLSAGAFVANRLILKHVSAVNGLFGLLTLGAMLVACTPFLFHFWTNGLHYIGAQSGWNEYLFQVFKSEVIIIAPPLLVIGALFPFLLKTAESYHSSSGRLVGQLIALNTVGAVLGSVTAGFVLLETLGVSASIRFVAMSYLLAGLYLIYGQALTVRRTIMIPLFCILLLVSIFDTSRLPVVRIDPVIDEESLLEAWVSSSATVAVVRRRNALKIKVNNYYTLGGTGSRELEELEGFLPVLLHPNPQSVFFLGLGTGISAGAVLHFPIQRLLVAELIPDVIEASEKYFGRYNNRLFFDQRVRIIAEDGRNFLAASREKFDIIIADLFVPWRSGAGSLYTLEHYLSIRKRLRENGLFMQWLPAYQLSKYELLSIARTITEVFPQVTFWRGDFSSRKPIIGLLAQTGAVPLATDAQIFSEERKSKDQERVPLLARYVGNMRALREELRMYPVSEDDKPLIEYQAPITQRRQKSKQVQWITGDTLIRTMQHIQAFQPLDQDPYLTALSSAQRSLPKAGMYLHEAQVLKQEGRLTAASEAYARFNNIIGLAP